MDDKDFDISEYGTPVFFFLPNDSTRAQRIGIIFHKKENVFGLYVSYFRREFYEVWPDHPPLTSYDQALKRVFEWNPAGKYLGSVSELEDMPIIYATKEGDDRFPLACFEGDDRLEICEPEIEIIPAHKIPSGTQLSTKVQWLFRFSRGPESLNDSSGMICLASTITQ